MTTTAQDRKLKDADRTRAAFERGVRNCPWVGALWADYMRFEERAGATAEKLVRDPCLPPTEAHWTIVHRQKLNFSSRDQPRAHAELQQGLNRAFLVDSFSPFSYNHIRLSGEGVAAVSGAADRDGRLLSSQSTSF